MSYDNGESSHWIWRIAGGIIVGVAAYFTVSYLETEDLKIFERIVISTVAGFLFVLFGKNLLHWIFDLLDW